MVRSLLGSAPIPEARYMVCSRPLTTIICIPFLVFVGCGPSGDRASTPDGGDLVDDADVSDSEADEPTGHDADIASDAPDAEDTAPDGDDVTEPEEQVLMSSVEVNDLLVKSDMLYVATESGLYALPAAGGEARQLDSSAAGRLRVNEEHLFFTHATDSLNIHRIDLSTRESYYDVYPGVTEVAAFDVDERFAYIVGEANPHLFSVDLSVAATRRLLAEEGGRTLLVFDDDLYFGSFQLRRIPSSGGTAEDVVTPDAMLHELGRLEDCIVMSTHGGLKIYEVATGRIIDLTHESRPLSGPVFTIRGDTLYYVDPDNRLYRYTLEHEPELVFEYDGPGWICAIEVSDGHLYYANRVYLDEAEEELFVRALP